MIHEVIRQSHYFETDMVGVGGGVVADAIVVVAVAMVTNIL